MSKNKIHTAKNLLGQVQDDIRNADAALHNLARYIETQRTLSDADRRALKRIVAEAREPLKKYDSF